MQKFLVPITLLATLTSLVAVGWALTREPAARGGEPAALQEQHQALQRRVAKLEAQVEALEEALQEAPSPEAPPVARAQGGAGGGAAPRERLQALVRAQEQREGELREALEEEGSEVRQKVQDIVRDEMEIRREERRVERTERMKTRLKESVAEFAQEHKLSPQQSRALESSLLQEREQIMALFDQARGGGGDFDKMRESAAERRAQTDEEVKSLLSGDALKAFQERRAEEAERFQRGPGRRGGF